MSGTLPLLCSANVVSSVKRELLGVQAHQVFEHKVSAWHEIDDAISIAPYLQGSGCWQGGCAVHTGTKCAVLIPPVLV